MNRLMTSLWLILVLAVSACDWISADEPTTEHKMYVYSNSGKIFYLVDYETFEVVRKLELAVPDSVAVYGMTLSTNRDHLFFKTYGPYPDPLLGFAVYDIEREAFEDLFFTEFDGAAVGPAYFIAAQQKEALGLVYAHFRDQGTYALDLFDEQVVEFISDEHDFVLDKRIYHSPDEEWIVVHKKWSGDIKGSFSELEFYTGGSGLDDLQFTLNENDKDSIGVYDFAFSADGGTLYVSYQLSEGRSRDKESYFGSYDLETRELHRSDLTFPWSLSGYFLAYSPSRGEVYATGSYGQFYIIDANTYSIKDTVTLSVKGEQSPILIRPDEKVAFVGYPSNDALFVIDLDRHRVIKTIQIEQPYNMIIP